MSEPVTTSMGMVDGHIVFMFNQPVDTISYPLESAQEVYEKLGELIEQAKQHQETLTNS